MQKNKKALVLDYKERGTIITTLTINGYTIEQQYSNFEFWNITNLELHKKDPNNEILVIVILKEISLLHMSLPQNLEKTNSLIKFLSEKRHIAFIEKDNINGSFNFLKKSNIVPISIEDKEEYGEWNYIQNDGLERWHLNSLISEVDFVSKLQLDVKKYITELNVQPFEELIEIEIYAKNFIENISNVTIITEGKTDWKYIIGALKYFHSINQYKNIEERFFYKFGSEEDLLNSICDTEVKADLSESELNKLLSSEISLRTGNPSKRKKIIIGIFDSDTNIKNKSKPEYGVFSFKIKPDKISTEFLFSDKEIKSSINGKRLYIGDEFDERTNQHNSENLNLGKGSQKYSGKKVIIDNDVFDSNKVNQALSKDEFSKSIYNHGIVISKISWEKFRHVFDEISYIISDYEK